MKEHLPQVLPKILWWIHEMRGHYFKLEYVKHLRVVAGAMIDLHTTAEYWKNRTLERLGIKMPQTYVVHLGNSKELMEVAEDIVARRVLREHIRESLGVRNEDLLFAIINSSRTSMKERDPLLTEVPELRNQELYQLSPHREPRVQAMRVAGTTEYSMNHAEEILNLQLELDILKTILGEEKSTSFELEERAIHANHELKVANEAVSLVNQHNEDLKNELKDVRSIIEACIRISS